MGRRGFAMTGSDEAVGYIISHCPTVGSFAGDRSPHRFLERVSEEMRDSEDTELFPSRHRMPIAYALDVIAKGYFLEPPVTLAAVYLATRLERFFRLLSGKLLVDGSWSVADPKNDRKILKLWEREANKAIDIRVYSELLLGKLKGTNDWSDEDKTDAKTIMKSIGGRRCVEFFKNLFDSPQTAMIVQDRP